MSIFSFFMHKKPKVLPVPVEKPRVDYDYEIAEFEGRLFFRNRNFTIEVHDVKFTTPPKTWGEKEYAILTFTYDIFEGAEYITSLGNEEFELLVGGWIQTELDKKH